MAELQSSLESFKDLTLGAITGLILYGLYLTVEIYSDYRQRKASDRKSYPPKAFEELKPAIVKPKTHKTEQKPKIQSVPQKAVPVVSIKLDSELFTPQGPNQV